MATKRIHLLQDIDVARIYENLLTVAFHKFLEEVEKLKVSDKNVGQTIDDHCQGMINLAYKFANNATDHWYAQLERLMEEQDAKQE